MNVKNDLLNLWCSFVSNLKKLFSRKNQKSEIPLESNNESPPQYINWDGECPPHEGFSNKKY